MRTTEHADVRVLHLDPQGPTIAEPGHANDLIGDAWGAEATVVAIPVERLDPAFFQLRSGLLGEITQKAVNYRIRLAVIGDITGHVAASDAFRDYVREANRGQSIWFLATEDDLATRLGEVTDS